MKLSYFNTKEFKVKQQFYDLGGYDFHRMILYLEGMHTLLKKQAKTIKKEYRQQLKKYPMDAQFVDEWYEGKKYDNEIGFVGLLYNTSLVATATIFEVVLKNICKRAAYKTHSKFKEPKMPVIDRCKEFLLTLKFDLEKSIDIWERINLVLQVRHFITHQGARYNPIVFDPKDKPVLEHIKNNIDYIFTVRPKTKKPRPFLIIDDRYIRNFIKDCEKYLLTIIEQIPEKRPKKSKKNFKPKYKRVASN